MFTTRNTSPISWKLTRVQGNRPEKKTKKSIVTLTDLSFKAHIEEQKAKFLHLHTVYRFKRIKGKRNSRKWVLLFSTPGTKRNTKYRFTAGAHRPRTGCIHNLTQNLNTSCAYSNTYENTAKAEHRASVVQEAQLNGCVRKPASLGTFSIRVRKLSASMI